MRTLSLALHDPFAFNLAFVATVVLVFGDRSVYLDEGFKQGLVVGIFVGVMLHAVVVPWLTRIRRRHNEP